jgi:hypothetical protein
VPAGCSNEAQLITNWKGSEIVTRASYLPQRLWLAATIDVLLDGKKILSTGGQLKFEGTYVQQFEYDQSEHTARLEWGRFSGRTIPSTLYIDEERIMQGGVNIENWQMKLIPQILFTFICFILLVSADLAIRVLIRVLGG